MADIKQAAKWLQEGKTVVRQSWPNHLYRMESEGRRMQWSWFKYAWSLEIMLQVDDLLADDWEIAE